jgi:hypothetical protein
MEQEWFRVRGIPYNQRSIKTMAKVGGLVGETLAIVEKTRLEGEYVRMRIACRNVTQVTATAEGTLGLKIYDFQFEREALDDLQSDKLKNGVKNNDQPPQPSPKKPRTAEATQEVNQTSPKTCEGGGKNYVSSGTGKTCKLAEAVDKEGCKKWGAEERSHLMGSEQSDEDKVQIDEEVEDEEESEDFNVKVAEVNASYGDVGSSKNNGAWLMMQ